MGKWTDLARQLAESELVCDNSAINADSRDFAPIGAIVTNGRASVSSSISPEIAQGIARLRSTSRPSGADRRVWREVVDDACRLVSAGWAATALDLSWSAMDLFGVEPPGSDDDYRNGLAVWLAGRRLILIDANSAIAANGSRRSIFNRNRSRQGAVLLWDLVGKRTS